MRDNVIDRLDNQCATRGGQAGARRRITGALVVVAGFVVEDDQTLWRCTGQRRLYGNLEVVDPHSEDSWLGLVKDWRVLGRRCAGL